MIRKEIVFVCLFTASTLSAIAQTNNYTINGSIKGVKKGWAILDIRDDKGIRQNDSALIIDSRFAFKAKALTYPRLAYLHVTGGSGAKTIFVGPGKTTVMANKDAVADAVVSGNINVTKWNEFENSFAPLTDFVAENRKKINEWTEGGAKAMTPAQDSMVMEWDGMLALKTDSLVEAFIDKNPGSVVSAFLITNFYSGPGKEETEQKLFTKLTQEAKQTYYGRQIAKAIAVNPFITIGKPAPVFTQSDTLGRNVSLGSFTGKYVLVDFWASWCGPCRGENPNVVKAYNTYKNQNFTVVSISLDNDKQKWLDAIHEDGLIWTHLCDLKGWKNEAAKLYAVSSIPANFLLDPNGIIIAKNLRGEELDKVLREKLGER